MVASEIRLKWFDDRGTLDRVSVQRSVLKRTWEVDLRENENWIYWHLMERNYWSAGTPDWLRRCTGWLRLKKFTLCAPVQPADLGGLGCKRARRWFVLARKSI